MQTSQHDFIPIFMQVLLAVGFVGGTILISNLLGPKRSSENKDKSFECGIESVGNARIPFSVKYFLVAILFVLFWLKGTGTKGIQFIDTGWVVCPFLIKQVRG